MMSYVSVNKIEGASQGNRLATLIADLQDRLAKRRVFRTTLRELQGLSARELDDLGLNRTMLRRIAWQAANGQ